MKKIICTGDFIYNSREKYLKFHSWIFKLFIPIIKESLNTGVDITFDIKDNIGEYFSREYFYNLANQTNIKDCHNIYNIDNFTDEQIDYLKKFFTPETIILGMEIYKPLCDLLTSFGCQIIDMAFNSYKLFDDLSLCFYTNNKEIYNKLVKYQIPQDKYYFYANYWKVFMENNNMIQDNDIEENSVLFIGQTLLDKSVEKNGKFLNVIDFEEKLKELSQNYSKIYYLPHPYLGKKRKLIYDWVKNSPYIELLTNRSTYGLLASDKIKKVVGISTSVLYEAQYFDKEIEYLYKPLFNIDASFEEHSYVSLLYDYFNPKFWADILSPICEIRKGIKDVNYFENAHNKMRNVHNDYWGYAQLDPIKRIPNTYDSIRQFWIRYIAPLF